MKPPTLSEALASGHGIERSFLCPSHGDSRPSASVNTLKMVWVCYTCGAAGRVGGEDRLADIDFVSLRNYIEVTSSPESEYSESWLNAYKSDDPTGELDSPKMPSNTSISAMITRPNLHRMR